MARGERAWSDFVRWCRARRLKPLPAHPWTVAAYARWCERRRPYHVIVHVIEAIAREHLLRAKRLPHNHPLVARTLRLIEARWLGRRSPSDLFKPLDFTGAAAPAAEPPKTGKARRRIGFRSTPPLVARRPLPPRDLSDA